MILHCVSALLASCMFAAWPDTPFTTQGRNIISASGKHVVFAGVTWPGAAETMLPEGLQYRSVAQIVGHVKSLGMNVIRLTYAIEMIDDILSESPNQGIKTTLIKALGEVNGTKVASKVLENNPSFKASTTRLEVFDAIAAECAKQQVWIHLDNHVSKAKWCCSTVDGNAWFGDLYFSVDNWQRGVTYMANHAKSWRALSSVSLRNELRPSTSKGNHAQPYNWIQWYRNVVPTMEFVHGNNSLPLIFISGLSFGTTDSTITSGRSLGTLNGREVHFSPGDFVFGKKIVYELHDYQKKEQCNDIRASLERQGYKIMNAEVAQTIHAPMVMTEFGFDQTGTVYKGAYAQCIKSFLTSQPGGPGGWMQWVISGSYYIRRGGQDFEDPFGLLNHSWSGWRNPEVIAEYVRPFVAATLK